jgi:hypothetical protein
VIVSRRRLSLLAAAAVLAATSIGLFIFGPGGPTQTPAPSASLAPTESIAPSPKPSHAAVASSMWTTTGTMVETRFGESATLLADGRVLMAGGESEWAGHGFTRTSAELFDPSTGQWTLTGSMHYPRLRQAAVRLADGRVLVVGGFISVAPGSDDRAQSNAEIYDPETGTWSDTSSMTVPRVDATATLLPDGRVLVAGGIAPGLFEGPLQTAEIYDPSRNAWAQAAPMSTARTSHTATLLPDGRVLVVGGGCCGQPALASAEVFDPTTGAWNATGSLASARRWLTSTPMADGRVLVFGGDNNGTPVTTAELWDPLTGRWAGTAAPASDGQAVLLQDGRVFMKGQGAGEIYDPTLGSWTSVGGPSHGRADQTLTLLLDGRVLLTYVEAAAIFNPSGHR